MPTLLSYFFVTPKNEFVVELIEILPNVYDNYNGQKHVLGVCVKYVVIS